MSSAIWTPAALWPERRRLAGSCWRVVESQHRISTMKLVDTVEEQEALEILLETTKPPVPPECRRLHYLLSTPFRYGAPYPGGSRFRRAGFTPGVFYASETSSTAIAEMAFHRLLFFAESPDTPWPANAGEYTAFSVSVKTAAALDLTKPPLSRDRDAWIDPTDYAGCQALAEQARSTRIEALRYESARDRPARGINVAILTCRAFVLRTPVSLQTWRIHLSASGARAMCDAPDRHLGFARDAFVADPRIAKIAWVRPGRRGGARR